MSFRTTLRSIAKSLPPPMQRGLYVANRSYRLYKDHIDLAHARPFRRFDGRHVAVAGFYTSGTGISRAAELVALTLERRGSRVTRVDMSSAIGRNILGGSIATPADCRGSDITDVVFVANPGQPNVATFDRDWLLERTIVAHWIWELEDMPPFWAKASDSFDEIWAATEYLTGSIRKLLPDFDRPIKVVRYAIDAAPFPRIDPARRLAARRSQHIADETFVAGYSFAVGSNFLRKNPGQAVLAFQRAFSDSSAMLLLRSADIRQWPRQRASLQRMIGEDRRIRLYDSGADIGMADFYAALDCYISPSRAEGYGLNLVEASQSGLPVITGGWRIAPEILQMPGIETVGYDVEKLPHDPQGSYNCVPGAVWSQPHLAELADALRRKARPASPKTI